MSEAILLDTNLLVDYFRGREKAVDLVRSEASRIILSAIVVAELYAGVKGEREEMILGNFIQLFEVVPVSEEIAVLGGKYRKTFGKSHGVGLADALIAASAELGNAELKTLNVKHFPMIRGLLPAY
jgi:predicted nucleic acid-binding protein